MFKRRIAAFSAAIIFAIGALVAEAVLNERDAAIDQAGAEAANVAAGLEERIRSSLDAAPDLKQRIEAGSDTFSPQEWKSVARGLLSNRQKATLGEAATIDLIRTDGVILARYTSARGFDTETGWARDLSERTLGAAQPALYGSYSSQDATEGVARLYRWRKVLGYPLIVAVGFGRAEVIAPANRQAAIVIGLGIAALSLPLIMLFMLNREISRRVESAIALDEESDRVRMEHAALLSISEELAAERIKLRRMNTELMREKRRAEEASETKSAFLANISHELRTPLNAILGFSEIIRDKLLGTDVDRYAAYAGDIHRSGEHLLGIVNAILDVTKLEAGKLQLHEERVRVASLIHRCVITLRDQASSGRIDLAGPAHDLGVSIYGDKNKLKQILVNLLSNAIKFTPPGGQVEIGAEAESDGEGLCLWVQDTGIGMTGDEIRQAQELFRQVDNSLSRRFEGAGLGLPLALRLTELHGGKLEVQSAPRKGTTVKIQLPSDRVIWDPGHSAEAADGKLSSQNRFLTCKASIASVVARSLKAFYKQRSF